MIGRISACLLVAVLAILASPRLAPAQQSFSFGLFGDLAYNAGQEPLLDNVLADIARTPLAFVAHVGDLGSPRAGSCTDELWTRRLAQFRALPHPLIYTPGDNEWTDCHAQQGVPGGDPLERLEKLRSTFFQGEESFGRRTLALTRQSAAAATAKYRENVRWDMGGVTFLTLHVPGSNNGLGRTAAGDVEFEERTAANLAWLGAGFAHAKDIGSRAIMVVQQANMFPELPPFPGGEGKPARSGFTELRAALAREAIAFGKPVVLVHGDSHYFRVDKPYMRLRSADEPAIENLTRLETFGAPHHHWVHVTVDVNDPDVFTIRQRLVPENQAEGTAVMAKQLF